MKKNYFLVVFYFVAFCCCKVSYAQIVGSEMYLQGHWVEIGMVNNASFGTTSSAPVGYHPHGFSGIGEVYDYGHDGWAVGDPTEMGDYTLPGDPQEGWAIQVNGTLNQAYEPGGYGCCGSLTGGLTTYSNTGGIVIGNWAGTASGGDLTMTQSTEIDTEASWVVMTTYFHNTGTTDIPGVYYCRTLDPDNDETDSAGSFTTVNTIVHQNDYDHRVQVSATGVWRSWAYIALGTKDCRALAYIIQGSLTPTSTLSDIYGETGSASSYYYSGQNTGDEGIGIVWNLGTIRAGDSAIVSYAYIFNNDAGIDSALPDPEIVTQGTAHDSVDTVVGCSVIGNTFPASIIHGADRDWTWSSWTWAPATGLSATTGVNVTVNLVALSGATTYTITGIDTSAGSMTDCNTKVFLLYVTPCFHATNNGPICANDTLKLIAHGDSTGATYFWYGPGGYTAFTQDATRTGMTMADTGLYYVVKIVGTERDTVSTDVQLIPVPVVTATSNGPVCSGNTLSLMANPDITGETFSWTGPDGFSSGLEFPSVTSVTTQYTGRYKVITSLSGCMDSTFEFVTVDSTPALPAIGNNSPLCSQRGTLILTSGDATPGVSYNWSGPGGFTSTLQNITIPDVSISYNGVYTATVSINYDGLLCPNSNFTTVTIDSTPIPPIPGSNSPVCSGNSLNLTASDTPGSLYNWVGPNAFISNFQNPSILPVTTFATGIYSVSATVIYTIPSVLGCTSDSATYIAVVDSTPATPSATSNSPGTPSICQGDTLRLFSADSTSPVDFYWTGPNAFTSVVPNPIITNILPAATGQYTVTVVYDGISLCPSSTVITVSITPTPALTASSNSPVCTGTWDTLFLKAASDPGATFSWTGPYVFRSLVQNPYRDPAIMEYGGIYQVTAFLNGCASVIVNDTVVINQTPPAPWVKWLTYCQNYGAPELQATGDSILWYTTSAANAVGTLTPPIPSTSAVGNTFYYATQTLNGCTGAVDSIQVSVFPAPSVTVTHDTDLCPNDSVLLAATDVDAIAYYHWSPSLYLSDTSGATTLVRPETNVTYTVVASNQFGCTDTATVRVNVLAAAVLYLGDSVLLYPGQTYQITPQTNCTSFMWFPPTGLDNAYISDPVASPQLSTKYVVYGKTSWGCIVEDSINVYVTNQSLLAVPNAFTPGTGPNNLFKVILQGEATLNNFTVYDRWGVKVFETSDINAGWDGSLNGTPQPQGVYIYQINAVSSTGQAFVKTGNVTLLR